MKKAHQKKARVVEEIKEKLNESYAAVLTDYRGLNVAQSNELRRQFKEAGVEYRVVKNTLTKRAAEDLGYNDLFPYLEGPTAIAFSKEDPVTPAKIISKFAEKNKDLEIKGGILGGTVVGKEQVKSLAVLPSREELLAQVARGFQGPITGLVNVLNAPLRNMVYVLAAIKDKKEAS